MFQKQFKNCVSYCLIFKIFITINISIFFILNFLLLEYFKQKCWSSLKFIKKKCQTSIIESFHLIKLCHPSIIVQKYQGKSCKTYSNSFIHVSGFTMGKKIKVIKDQTLLHPWVKLSLVTWNSNLSFCSFISYLNFQGSHTFSKGETEWTWLGTIQAENPVMNPDYYWVNQSHEVCVN